MSGPKNSPGGEGNSTRGDTPTQPIPIGALLRMGQACTREEAQDQARALLAAGADPGTVADALAEWDELQAQSVREVNPSPTRCLCSHALVTHTDGQGSCWNFSCGCTRFRSKEVPF